MLFGPSTLPPNRPKFTIDSAQQGQEGLALVRKAVQTGRPYALAFVDARMPPGWDGIETTERIWQICSDLQVVICTAYSDYSWDEVVERLGQTDSLLILRKPFDAAEVRQLACALSEKWHLNQLAKCRVADLETMVEKRTAELEGQRIELENEIWQRKPVSEELLQHAFPRFAYQSSESSLVRGSVGTCLYPSEEAGGAFVRRAVCRPGPVQARQRPVRTHKGGPASDHGCSNDASLCPGPRYGCTSRRRRVCHPPGRSHGPRRGRTCRSENPTSTRAARPARWARDIRYRQHRNHFQLVPLYGRRGPFAGR